MMVCFRILPVSELDIIVFMYDVDHVYMYKQLFKVVLNLRPLIHPDMCCFEQ